MSSLKTRKTSVIAILPFIVFCDFSQANPPVPIKANPADVISICDLGAHGISKDYKVKRVTGAVLEAEVHSGCLSFATDSDFGYPTDEKQTNGSIILQPSRGAEVTLPVLVQQRTTRLEPLDETGKGQQPKAKVIGLTAGNLVTAETQEIKVTLIPPHKSYDDPKSSTCSIHCPEGKSYINSSFKYQLKENTFVLPPSEVTRLFKEMPLGECSLSANFVSADGELAEVYEMMVQKALMTIEGRVVGPDGKLATEFAGRLLDVKVPGAGSSEGYSVVVKVNPDGTFKVGPLPTTPNNSYMISLVDLRKPLSVTATAAPLWQLRTPYVLHVDLGVNGGVSKSYSK